MEFDWDDGNRDKTLRHGVYDWEIEEAFADRFGILAGRVGTQSERRFLFLGRSETSGSYLRVVFTYRMKSGRRAIRPISASRMSPRDRRRYQAK